jgi:hypothetical protein
MSVSARDAWSSLSQVRWNFGDGTAANGGSVSHAYGSAGAYTVTVTATDSRGNARTATRRISVSSPPPPPPPPGNNNGGPPPPGLIPSTVTNNWLAFPAGYTKVSNLSVNNLLAGTTVKVTCKTKSKNKQRKGCPYKTKRYTTSGARAKLNLLKPFKQKKLPTATKVTISVTVPGQIGKRFSYTMRKGKIPKKQLRCISPDGKISTCS